MVKTGMSISHYIYSPDSELKTKLALIKLDSKYKHIQGNEALEIGSQNRPQLYSTKIKKE
jgi:hypothetical protein